MANSQDKNNNKNRKKNILSLEPNVKVQNAFLFSSRFRCFVGRSTSFSDLIIRFAFTLCARTRSIFIAILCRFCWFFCALFDCRWIPFIATVFPQIISLRSFRFALRRFFFHFPFFCFCFSSLFISNGTAREQQFNVSILWNRILNVRRCRWLFLYLSNDRVCVCVCYRARAHVFFILFFSHNLFYSECANGVRSNVVVSRIDASHTNEWRPRV